MEHHITSETFQCPLVSVYSHTAADACEWLFSNQPSASASDSWVTGGTLLLTNDCSAISLQHLHGTCEPQQRWHWRCVRQAASSPHTSPLTTHKSQLSLLIRKPVFFHQHRHSSGQLIKKSLKYFLLIPHSSKTPTVEVLTSGIITPVVDFSHVLFSQTPLTLHPIEFYNNKNKWIPMPMSYSNNNSHLIFFEGVHVWINTKCEQRVHSLLQYGKLMLSVYCQKWNNKFRYKTKDSSNGNKNNSKFPTKWRKGVV